MKIKYILLIVLFLAGIALIIQNRYNTNKRETEAKTLIQLSNDEIELGNLEDATRLLDSLRKNYSSISGVIYTVDKMDISIQKTLYNDSIIRIIKEIDESNIKGQTLIDSLERQKTKLRLKYAEIEVAESKYQCKQCAIYLQNARK